MDLILGHNQFIGISHTSEERGIELQKRFQDPANIYRVVEIAADLGYKNMVIETHPKMLEFLNYYLKNQTFDMNFYLQVPYIQGYIQKMGEKGASSLFMDLAHRGGFKALSAMAFRNALNLARKDFISMGVSALQFEIAPFLDVNIKALLLHNVTTDLLLSLNVGIAFKEYTNYVKDTLKLIPGFVTLNFSFFENTLKKNNLGMPLVMTPINLKGYDMSPSKQVVEASINTYKGDIIAMNILGGGAFSLYESNEYLRSFNNIHSCVVGASSKEHLYQIYELFH